MNFGQPLYLWALVAAVPAMAGLFYWSWHVKHKLMRQFIGSRLLEGLLAGYSPRRQALKLWLLVAAVAGILLALARPQWGYTWEEARVKGLDILVALDTSRSMLAQDVNPNRLDKAKLAIYDLMRQAKNDRLGLVVFAGNAFLQTPLTLDDQAFRQGLDAVNVGIIPQGGTAISTAIRTATAAFEKANDNHKILVLFTDGEDHDSDVDTLAAAKEAAEAGVHIFTVGVGTQAGDLLRVRDDQGNYSFVKDEDGNVVKSHLNQALLQEIATEAGGFYLPLQGADPMATLYARGLAPLPKSEGATRQAKIPLERYKWPLGFAVLCLLLETLLPESPRRMRRTEPPSKSAKTVAQVAALCLLFAAIGAKGSPSSAYHDYESGNYKSSFDEFDRLSGIHSNDYRLHYDAGAAAYKAKQFEKAEKQLNETLASPTVAPDVRTQERTYYDLGNTEFHLGEPLTDADKKKERWQQAVNNYIQALKLDTNDFQAHNNLAFVRQKLQELKKQQQQQQKQNKNQQNQDQQNQKNQDQKNQDQKNKNNQNQQQQASNQNQKQNQNQKNNEERKRQQEQARREQQKQQQQQQAQNGEKKDQQKEQQEAMAGEMTPEEARQILNADKGAERALIFQPTNQPASAQPGKFKNW